MTIHYLDHGLCIRGLQNLIRKELVKYLILFILFIHLSSHASEQIVLAVGASQKLAVRGNIHFSNNRILKAVDLGRFVQISGKSVGDVEIDSKDESYHVEVIRPDEFRLYSKYKNLISGMRGLTLKVHKGKIQVGGELLRKNDWIKLSQNNLEETPYEFHANLDSGMRKEMTRYFHEVLTASDLPFVSLQMAPVAQVSLTKSMLRLRKKYEKAFGSFGFVVEQNSSLLNLEPLVRVNILVAEVRRNFSRALGVAMPGAAAASLLPSFQVPGDGQGINAQINALESEGKGHLLAAPTLLCRSGKNAEFLAGGEIPIKMLGLEYHETTWKKYGVLLRMSPLADATGRMSIALTTEVSMLDPSHSVEGVPGLLTNRIESHFDLKKTRTIALSGLLKNEWFRNSEGLPWLSQIPVLGYLFSSKEFKSNETELVIFVTPEVIQPDAIDEEDT